MPLSLSINKFVTPGFLLSIDLLLVSLVNWVYWLIISTLTTTSEVGEATSVYSFAALTWAISLLGLEYALVKRSSAERFHILGTSIILESLIIVISIPILVYVLNNLLHGSLSELTWIAIGIVFFSSQRYIMRYALLGIYDARSVLIINSIGATIQLGSGYFLVAGGFGAAGILLSFLINYAFITVFTFAVAKKSFKLRIGDLRYSKGVLKDAIVNMPTPLAKTVIYSLSVVLLASFGISPSDIGIFYIALMLSLVGGGFAANIALMVIPVSSDSKKDLSTESIRIGLSLTAPIIVTLMVAPKAILSAIGPEYASADMILVVLSAGIFPYTILINAISKFNNIGKPKQIIAIGSIHLIVFLGTFALLVPSYGTLGAAFSVLISSTVSAVSSLVWSEKGLLLRYTLRSLVSIFVGLATGYAIQSLFGFTLNPIIPILASLAVVLLLIFSLKNTSPLEIARIAKGLGR
jgi:O-antigen/teichoic acid export membrane protein